MSKKTIIIIFCVMVICYLTMGIIGIVRMSLTFDEMAHIPAGYTYLAENDYRLNSQDHPPLAKLVAAAPLLFLEPLTFTHHPFWKKGYQWGYGDLFLYNNRITPDHIINTERIMLLIVSALLGFVVFLWARTLGGNAAGLISAGLCYFFPGFIANGGLVTTDMPMALCYFFVMYRFFMLYRDSTIKNTVLLGISIGLTLSVKFSGILIFPSIACMLVWWYICDRRINLQKTALYGLYAGIAAILVIAIAYRFAHLDRFIFGIKYIFTQVEQGRSSYLLGNYSVAGWWYYFPVTILLKTPIGILLLCLISFSCVPAVLVSKNDRNNALFLLIPSVVYFASSINSPMQIGHRHILPVYPFVFTWLGWACTRLSKRLKIAASISLLGVFIGVIYAQPYNLEYFNAFIGSRNNAYKYLVDSNLDWGQGLKEFAAYAQNLKDTVIILSYFGTADPHAEGIRYVPLLCYDMVNRKGDSPDTYDNKRILFVISATQRQAVYFADKDSFVWLDKLTPIRIIAYSIFVYDLTGKTEALGHVEHLLRSAGNKKEAIKIAEHINVQ